MNSHNFHHQHRGHERDRPHHVLPGAKIARSLDVAALAPFVLAVLLAGAFTNTAAEAKARRIAIRANLKNPGQQGGQPVHFIGE